MRIGSIGSAIVAVLFGVALSAAGVAAAMEFQSGERLRSVGAYPGKVFLSGREVTAQAATPDDMFVAGGEVRIEGASADHLFVVGGDVRFSAVTAQDVLVAGGRLDFGQGHAARDVVAAAGRIRIRPGFQIDGSALLAGGRIEVEGPVGGDLRAGGGVVVLNAAVAGDVELSGEELVIGPAARIGGDLTYRGARVEISPQAVIEGQRIERSGRPGPEPGRMAAAAIAAAGAFLVVFTLGGALLVLAVGAAFPGLMNLAAERIRSSPLPTLGAGFLLMVVGPVLMALLFFSVLGIPLAFLVLALYLATAPLALAAVVHFLGMAARRRMRRGAETAPAGPWPRFGWAVLTLLVLTIIGIIPLIGGVVWLVAYVAGLGAVAIEGRRALAG